MSFIYMTCALRTWAIMVLQNVCALYVLGIVFFLLSLLIPLLQLFTWSPYVGYSLLSSVFLAFNKFWECWIFQTLFANYMLDKFQLSVFHYKYESFISLKLRCCSFDCSVICSSSLCRTRFPLLQDIAASSARKITHHS